MSITNNTLFYGDNLPILRDYIASESVDLVYLDPPFNSSRSYNVLFKEEGGQESQSQITAFDDTWHWGHQAEELYAELVTGINGKVGLMIGALRGAIGENQMMAYLVMIAGRLVELHRVLKPTGSLYLHCDPTASHYLKIILDTIFDVRNFRNEIIWKRTNAHNDAARKFPDLNDSIFLYSKSNAYTFNVQHLPYSEHHIETSYRNVDANGRRYASRDLRSPNPRPNLTYEYKGYKPHQNGWSISRELMERYDEKGLLLFPSSKEGRIRLKVYLDEMPGVPVGNIWDDIPPIQAQAAERLGYPTQKPIALLERILLASSNPGDVVLDPFCGCGTTVAAAQKLGRQWIGIDITHLAITLQKYRLQEMFPGITFDVIGEPEDLGAAKQLANDDKYQFQWWALSLVKARPLGGDAGSKQGKKGADKGIDGVITFIDDASAKPKRVIVQVKGGHVGSQTIRDLRGTIEREQAAIGVLITLEPATKAMETEAVSASFYESPGWGKSYPRLQILTIEQLLHGTQVQMPPAYGTFKQATKVKAGSGLEQPSLGL